MYKYCSSTIYRLMLQVAILLALWKLSIYLLGWNGGSQLLYDWTDRAHRFKSGQSISQW